jgi:hypothetical protein
MCTSITLICFLLICRVRPIRRSLPYLLKSYAAVLYLSVPEEEGVEDDSRGEVGFNKISS